MKKISFSLILAGLLTLIIVGAALADNPNPGVVPNEGQRYGQLGARWWQWAFSFPAAEVPFFNPGGSVDISAGQSGNVWFLAGQAFTIGGPVTRTGEVPSGKYLFFPLVNLVNDYPCPDPTFQPDPGESLKHFLQRTGNGYLDDYFAPDPSTLFAEIDGVSLDDLPDYRAMSNLFKFTADPILADPTREWYDPCITGTRQPGVSVGYWILLEPMAPGEHTLHFGVPSAGQDITYKLTVTPSH